MRNPVFSRIAVALCGAFFILAPAVDGQGAYPPPREPYVNDFANRLSAADQERIRHVLNDARRQTGIEGTVVLIDSIHDYPAGGTGFEAFATGLFNAWGVGAADRNDGVLILVALADRKVRIELGAGYTARDSQLMQTVVDRHLVPRLRAGDVAGALYEGARAALATLADPPPAVERVLPEAPSEVRTASAPPLWRRPSIHWIWVVPVLGLMFLPFVTIVAVIVRSFGPRKCPDCRLVMIRLDEASDDGFLTSQQRTEEAVGSVNYDVWRCERCETTQVVPRYIWSSSFRACPGCGARTLSTETFTLLEPTYSWSGRQKVDGKCVACSYEDSRIVDVPRLTRSDASSSTGGLTRNDASTSTGGISASNSYSRGWSRSSSPSYSGGSSSGKRSSFGGGSSSGRGASGSW